MAESSILQDQLKDHEERLRALEKNYTETKVNLLNIEKSQSELKLMITQNNQQVLDMLKKFVNSDIESRRVNQKNTWNLVFKIWVVLAPVLAVFINYWRS